MVVVGAADVLSQSMGRCCPRSIWYRVYRENVGPTASPRLRSAWSAPNYFHFSKSDSCTTQISAAHQCAAKQYLPASGRGPSRIGHHHSRQRQHDRKRAEWIGLSPRDNRQHPPLDAVSSAAGIPCQLLSLKCKTLLRREDSIFSVMVSSLCCVCVLPSVVQPGLDRNLA